MRPPGGPDRSRKEGFIPAAEGGTLFLEELGEMPIDVQSKLVRFLRDRSFFPVGSSRPVAADVLVVAASSTASGIPDALVGRLGARPIRIPPLRERLEDMGHLVARFLTDAGAERAFEPEAFQALLLYEWSQNLRELRKVVAQAAVFSDGEERIGFDHLPTAILDALEGAGVADDVQGAAADRASEDTAKITAGGHPAAGTTRVRRPLPSADELTELMRLYHGNVSHVAKHLRRQWTVIWQSLRRNGIDPASFRDRPS
jgi:DNA-binding NtrC family response regulator